MDEARLHDALEVEFGGTDEERRVVVRQASDLAASGQHKADRGVLLTAREVITNLNDAPDGSPAERWNWWMGALEFAYGDYEEFFIRRYPSGSRE